MKLLFLFTFVIIVYQSAHVASHLGTKDVSNDIVSSETLATGSSAPRSPRAVPADAMKQSVERMQMISRLANAIYLQKGLVNGTKIETEKLISELLHFGAITPSNIQSINDEKIAAALTDLGGLPGKIKENDLIKSVVNFFAGVKSITKHMPDVKNITIWPGIKNFTADMTKLKDGKINKTFIDGLTTSTGGFAFAYSRLIKLKAPFADDSFDPVKNLIIALEEIQVKSEELEIGIPKIFKFTNKKSATDSFSYMSQIYNGVKELNDDISKLSIDKKGFEELNDNVETIKATVNRLKNGTSSLELVRDFIVTYSTKSQSTPLEYTIGLPGGYSDINLLFDHFHNSWFKSIVKDQKLEDALSRLKLWRANVDNIRNPLDKITGDKVNKISEVFDFSSKLVKDYAGFDIGKAKAVGNCVQNRPDPTPIQSEIGNLIEHVKKVDEALNKINSNLQKVRDYLKTEENKAILQQAIKVLEGVKNNDKASLEAAVNSLVNDQKLKELPNFINLVDEAINAIKSTDIIHLKMHANNSVSLLSSIDTYFKAVAVYSPIIDCFLAEKANLNKAETVIEQHKTLRALSKDQTHQQKFQDVLDVLNTVVKTRNDLKALDTSMKGMKGFKSKESDLLNLLVRDEHHYKVIGLSTEGVVVLKRTAEGKSDLDALKIHANLGKDETSKVNNLSPAEKNLMDELASVGPSLDPFYKTLDIWIDQLNKQNFTTLANYSLIFKTAKNVTGPDHDYEKMDAVLGKLIASSNNKDSLKKVREAVRMLIGTGVKHASYTKSYDESEKSLEAMDLFFAKFSANVSATPAPPVGQSRNRPGYGTQSGSQVSQDGFPPVIFCLQSSSS